MDDSLSARQIQILKALIDEYIETAEAVGSDSLEKKYNLGVSPATIRNEMATLSKIGFLKQPHTSSGRVPSSKAMKFYISQLMEEKKMTVTEEVKAKEQVWDARSDLDTLFRETTQALADKTDSLAVGVLGDEGKVWHSGYANVFANPEFANALVCEHLFGLIEEVSMLSDLFFHRPMRGPVDVFFGDEMGFQYLEPVSVVASRFNVGGQQAALGVIGPTRLRYHSVIPIIRYFGHMLEEITQA